MSFVEIKSKARNRFNETQIYLNHIISLEPQNPTDQPSIELKILRGLFQVQLYASLEKTINDIVEYSLSNIASRRIKNSHFNISFNTVSLSDKLKLLKDSGYSSFFPKAIELFLEISNPTVHPINEALFAKSLQNIWAKTIEETIGAFGIKGYNIGVIERSTINELVEKRNAVAHGRESASTIGERQRADVLRRKMDIIVIFTYEIIDLFENYCTNKGFLKPYAKKYYPN
jgi:hypothetical protein